MTIEIARTEIRFSVRHDGTVLFARIAHLGEDINWYEAADGFELGARATLADAARRFEGVDWP